MTDRPPPPPLPINHRITTTQLLKQSTSIFTTHFLTFTFLSLLLFTFRSNVENGTHILTSFIDGDPSLKSILTRLHVSGPPTTTTTTTTTTPSSSSHHLLRQRRRRPFLQLTRVGTLDDDFFSGDDDIDRSLFGSLDKPQLNGTSLILNNFDPELGFSNFVSDNGIRVSSIVRTGVSFKALEAVGLEEVENETVITTIEDLEDLETEGESDRESERILDFHYLLKGFELRHQDTTALVFLVGILSATYGYVILGFLVTYAWVLGITFVVVSNDLVDKYKSIFRTIWDGSYLGLKRLSGFILMKWAVRDALTQLLGIWYFGEIDDQYSFFKIFVRLKLMPFSIMSSWVKGFEKECTGFIMAWFLLDTLLGFIFAVDAWIVMLDSRKSGREVVKEGCHLLTLMLNPAINIKCLEEILCCSFTRWMMSRFFGKLFASAFQSVTEVYFMVVWLMYYFSVKSKDANSSGEPFGRRELEGLLEGVR